VRPVGAERKVLYSKHKNRGALCDEVDHSRPARLYNANEGQPTFSVLNLTVTQLQHIGTLVSVQTPCAPPSHPQRPALAAIMQRIRLKKFIRPTMGIPRCLKAPAGLWRVGE
jgi:hypothetical protein